MLFYLHMLFFGAFGMKETRQSLRVWRCLVSASRIMSSRLNFWDKGNFSWYSSGLIDLMESSHIGCV